MPTVAALLAESTRRLTEAGVETAALDSELLLRHVLGWDRAALLAANSASPAPHQESEFRRLVAERAQRRPLQHLTGVQHFWKHAFKVTPDVLIPRPETELLVEAALTLLRPLPTPLVADVGTGSGCIALSLAGELPRAEVHATDASPAALDVARENAARLGLGERVRFHRGDVLEPLAGLEGRLHLVASNPPYVDAAEWQTLPPEVRDHEPALALRPRGDRYSIYRALTSQARRMLCPAGWLLVEIGRGMEDEVRRICTGEGFAVERIIPDLRSIPRTVMARKTAGP